MAAGVSTYAMVQALIPEIWEGALFYLQKNFVAAMNVQVFNDRVGFTPRNVSEYISSGTAQSLTEATDLTAYEFDRDLLSTLTPAEIGHRIDLYDARVETDPENVFADAARELGYVLGTKMETDILGNIVDFTGGSITAAGDFSIEQAFKGRALLAEAGVPGPYTVIMHEYQYLDIHSDLIALSSPADLSIRNQVLRNYYLPGIADINFVVAPHMPRQSTVNEAQSVDITGTPTGGTFQLQLPSYDPTAAIAFDAVASAVQSALEAVVGVGNVTVTGTNPTFTVTFTGVFSGGDIGLLTLYDNSLTGGSSPSVSIAEDNAGSAVARAGIFNSQAIALDLRRGLRIEPDRDASARRSELNATMVYAHGVWRANHGVILQSDASTPS